MGRGRGGRGSSPGGKCKAREHPLWSLLWGLPAPVPHSSAGSIPTASEIIGHLVLVFAHNAWAREGVRGLFTEFNPADFRADQTAEAGSE